MQHLGLSAHMERSNGYRWFRPGEVEQLLALAVQGKVPVEVDPQRCLRDGRCVAILKPDSSLAGVDDGGRWERERKPSVTDIQCSLSGGASPNKFRLVARQHKSKDLSGMAITRIISSVEASDESGVDDWTKWFQDLKVGDKCEMRQHQRQVWYGATIRTRDPGGTVGVSYDPEDGTRYYRMLQDVSKKIRPPCPTSPLEEYILVQYKFREDTSQGCIAMCLHGIVVKILEAEFERANAAEKAIVESERRALPPPPPAPLSDPCTGDDIIRRLDYIYDRVQPQHRKQCYEKLGVERAVFSRTTTYKPGQLVIVVSLAANVDDKIGEDMNSNRLVKLLLVLKN